MSVDCRCALPWHALWLHADGRFGPCCFIKYPGRVPTDLTELRALFDSPPMRRLRARLARDEVAGSECAGCAGAAPALPPEAQTHAAAFAARSEVTGGVPTEIDFNTSEGCNIDCIMCFQTRTRPVGFPVARAARLLEEGSGRFRRIHILGGEPLFTRDGREIIALAARHAGDAWVHVTTNGLLLGEMLPQLAAIPRLHLQISVDGYGEAYERIRRLGKWETLLAGMRAVSALLAERPRWRVSVRSIVMRSSLASLQPLAELAHELGFEIDFSPVRGSVPGENIFMDPPLLEGSDWEGALTRALDFCRAQGMLGPARQLAALAAELAGGRSLPDRLEPAVKARIERLVELLGDRPVVVQGAGEHTLMLLAHTRARELNLVAVADVSRRKQQGELAGLPLIAPRDILAWGADLLVSSKVHEAEIAASARRAFGDRLRVHTLYASHPEAPQETINEQQ